MGVAPRAVGNGVGFAIEMSGVDEGTNAFSIVPNTSGFLYLTANFKNNFTAGSSYVSVKDGSNEIGKVTSPAQSNNVESTRTLRVHVEKGKSYTITAYSTHADGWLYVSGITIKRS